MQQCRNTVATVAPSLAATFRAMLGSAQYTSVFHGWHAWRLMIRIAPVTTGSSCPRWYVPSWHAVTIASAACSCAACSVGWYASANSSGPIRRPHVSRPCFRVLRVSHLLAGSPGATAAGGPSAHTAADSAVCLQPHAPCRRGWPS